MPDSESLPLHRSWVKQAKLWFSVQIKMKAWLDSMGEKMLHRLRRWAEHEAKSGGWPGTICLHTCEWLSGLPVINVRAHALAGFINHSAGRYGKAFAHYQAALDGVRAQRVDRALAWRIIRLMDEVRANEDIDSFLEAASSIQSETEPLPIRLPPYRFKPAMATLARANTVAAILDRNPQERSTRVFLALMENELGHHRQSMLRLHEAASLLWPTSFKQSHPARRMLPSFLIIGQAKAGTTSLHHYLFSHPDCMAPLLKEPHFWSSRYAAGLDWYTSFFPPASSRSTQITGEASTSYFPSEDAPWRIAAHLPDIKLILLIRDPVDRAYSHYQMSVRNDREFRSWETVLEAVFRRWPHCPLDPDDLSSGHQISHYLTESASLPHLKRWLSHFPKEQMLILRTSSLAVNLQGTLDRVFAFLGLVPFVPISAERVNVGSYPPMAPEIEQRLREWFAPHEWELESFLTNHHFVS